MTTTTECLVVHDREALLRAGHMETSTFGGQDFYFYWEPHFVNGVAQQDFCIEWTGVFANRKEYIHDFDAAVKRYEEIERQAIIDAAVTALLGPQDTVKIRRPPKF